MSSEKSRPIEKAPPLPEREKKRGRSSRASPMISTREITLSLDRRRRKEKRTASGKFEFPSFVRKGRRGTRRHLVTRKEESDPFSPSRGTKTGKAAQGIRDAGEGRPNTRDKGKVTGFMQ